VTERKTETAEIPGMQSHTISQIVDRKKKRNCKNMQVSTAQRIKKVISKSKKRREKL